jgi:hypothetical protein
MAVPVEGETFGASAKQRDVTAMQDGQQSPMLLPSSSQPPCSSTRATRWHGRGGRVFLALVLVHPIAAVQSWTARTKLAYETWHCIHLLTHIALALSFEHELGGPNLAGAPDV